MKDRSIGNDLRRHPTSHAQGDTVSTFIKTQIAIMTCFQLVPVISCSIPLFHIRCFIISPCSFLPQLLLRPQSFSLQRFFGIWQITHREIVMKYVSCDIFDIFSGWDVSPNLFRLSKEAPDWKGNAPFQTSTSDISWEGRIIRNTSLHI